MKNILKILLQYYLKFFAKLVILIKSPKIIVIAGSSNKIFVKDEVARVLGKNKCSVRVCQRNFNTEIGLSLTILDLPSGFNSYKNWLPAILNAPKRLFTIESSEYLVLPLGISDPGDMKFLLSIIKPDVAIITDLTQRHLEAFKDMDHLVGEYRYLIRNIKKGGRLFLNYDNERISKMKNLSSCPVVLFGFADGAQYQILENKRNELGQKVVVLRKGQRIEKQIKRFGTHHVYAYTIGLIVEDYVSQEKKKNQK